MGSNSTLNLNGRVEKTDIPTLLRAVEKDKLTGELSFSKTNERVDLYFLFGQLYHAKWRDISGLDAVTELLTWRTGNYIFTEGIIPAQASINDDIEKILGGSAPVVGKTPSTPPLRSGTSAGGPTGYPTPQTSTPSPQFAPPPAATRPTVIPERTGPGTGPLPTNPGHLEMNPEIAAFDLGALAPVPPRQPEPRPRSVQPALSYSEENTSRPRQYGTNITSLDSIVAGDAGLISDRIAPAPPANGQYRTRYFCLPAGEQMATSLVATGPQLEEELMHLADVGFTGYVLGTPEVEGYPAVGICLYTGRFIHAFVHAMGSQIIEGEKAYRMILDPHGSQSTRFYWFYEVSPEHMRAAISLLTPPSRYVHLEARIIRFREMMQVLSDDSHTGCLKITVPAGSQGPNLQPTPLAGECAYLPIFQGKVMGIWTENNPRVSNDGPLLQRFLAEPLAFLDLHSTAPVNEPGLPLENLIGNQGQSQALTTTTTVDAVPISTSTVTTPVGGQVVAPPVDAGPPPPSMDDDERQLQLITSIGRMESTWTQMQLKDKLDDHTKLLALAGFVNEVLSLSEAVSGKRNVQELVNRGMRQELAPFRTIFQLLDLPQGRINIMKLLKEYELFQRDSDKSGNEFYRETGRGLRTLIRSAFQYYVSLIRQENIRFECQEMYEVFLQEVVKKM